MKTQRLVANEPDLCSLNLLESEAESPWDLIEPPDEDALPFNCRVAISDELQRELREWMHRYHP